MKIQETKSRKITGTVARIHTRCIPIRQGHKETQELNNKAGETNEAQIKQIRVEQNQKFA